MVARTHPVNYSFRDYVAHDDASSTKHEYLNGQIYAMAGGTPEHSALIASVTAALAAQTRGGPCRVHSSDLRVRVIETGLATYPEVTVVCGPWQRDPDDARTIVNPSVVVEVLSPSTAAYDRGEKVEHYKRIPSLRAIVLFEYERHEAVVWQRAAGGEWLTIVAAASDHVHLTAIGATLGIGDTYAAAAEPGPG